TEQFQVVGSAARLAAVAGEDLVLPCFIKPNISAVNMRVEWWRLKDEASLVHLYKDHKDVYEDQDQSYSRRTSMFKDELQKGDASLKLSALRVSDEGAYKCLITDKSWYDDVTVHVTVEAQGNHPVITMESYDNSGGINLVCESRGWKPEPEVLWLDSKGVTLPAEDTQIHRETEGFSVKLHITVHDYTDSNRFYCRLLQKDHMMETEIIINSKVFAAWKWIVGISVSVCLLAVGMIVTAVICYKKEYLLQICGIIKIFFDNCKMRLCVLYCQQWLLPWNLTFLLNHESWMSLDVILDPDTANPYLILSADGKQVTCGDELQNLPDTPQRFTKYVNVLGKQIFSSGRFYYEVQVRGKTEWDLGVVRENINRKGEITVTPEDGFWIVRLRNKNQYWAPADTDVPLTLREKVEKVGVFVDYEEGLVSFYDVNSRSHIYSFTGQTFTEKLYPFFCPCLNEGSKNSAPLII
ncbi:butyrophilin-like protein 3, partial [Silurus meridionalis]